jgi:hypothetical protein
MKNDMTEEKMQQGIRECDKLTLNAYAFDDIICI